MSRTEVALPPEVAGGRKWVRVGFRVFFKLVTFTDEYFVGKSFVTFKVVQFKKTRNPTRTHFLPPATSGGRATAFRLISTSRSSPWWYFDSIHATNDAVKGRKETRIGGGETQFSAAVQATS